MTSQHKVLADGSVEIRITMPWVEIEKEYQIVIDSVTKTSQMPGFRKGKVPKKLVEQNVDKSKTYEEVLKRIIPKAYNDAISAEKVKPVVTPKVELQEALEGKDWVILAHTCERPKITLGNYKKAVHELNATKRNKIWTPGQDKKETENKPQKPTLEELVRALLSEVQTFIPPILLEYEVNRLLSDLIDQTKRLGLSVEQYLASTGKNADSLRKEYEEQARKTITLELALEDIADREGIILSDDDIEAVLKTAKTDEERKALEAQRYYLASVLRRQKTLDTLASL